MTASPAASSPAATSASAGGFDQEVTFGAGADTVYSSVMLPAAGGSGLPAALIISGSGPTDRDGNNILMPGRIDTNLRFAQALAAQGVRSLRYDKLGTGKTGLLGRTNPGDFGFDTFVDEARAAYTYLKSRPDVDLRRVMLLGHSEGALIALVLADELGATGEPRALVLAAPPGFRYLDLIRRQLSEQVAQAQQTGRLPADQAQALLAETDRGITGLRQTGAIPEGITNPALRPIFSAVNARFLAQADRYDPRALAAGLPPTLPALLLRGAKDQQVSADDMRALMDGFHTAGNTSAAAYELPDVNHVFKEVAGTPNPAVDYINPALPFSQEAVVRLAAFVRATLR